MLSEFTKIVDRNFIIGYLLPTVLFISATIMLVHLFFPQGDPYTELFLGQSLNITNSATSNEAQLSSLQKFFSVSFAVLCAILFSIILLVINRVLIRLLEGYYFKNYNPLSRWKRYRFRQLTANLNKISSDREAELNRRGKLSDESKKKYELRYMETLLILKERFPPGEDYILPSSFGNVIRAFELYPKELYGIDSIPIWVRILPLVPRDSTGGLNDSKAQVDLAVNLIYLTLIVLIEYFVFAKITGSLPMMWIPILTLLVAAICYEFALVTAIEWGHQVKAIFDIYRYTLLKKMGIKIPSQWNDEKIVWQKISRAFLYQNELDVERDPKNTEDDNSVNRG